MANSTSTNKSTFLEDWLKNHPESKESEVAEAWKSAGNAGTISPSLFYKIKNDLGLRVRRRRGSVKRTKHAKHVGTLGRGRGRPKMRAETAAVVVHHAEPTHRGSSARTLVELERELDHLIFQLMNVGGLDEVETLLRQARRILVRSHEG
jgi:hypothetical protein